MVDVESWASELYEQDTQHMPYHLPWGRFDRRDRLDRFVRAAYLKAAHRERKRAHRIPVTRPEA